ncbi:MAG: bifunctional glutamate N-acetyltransferase/amino-acid acetyltransferase ArgJ [Acidiferrobacterales bacterium]|nr:bifunctional glutamate N-acetyltransferase/amino-acid acetyltransferase ArgJ [Acidiferrobacterales bacterium]
MSGTISPLAPPGLPDFSKLSGVRLATAATGVKYQGREDLLLVDLEKGSVGAGIFTRSTAAGAPVVWCREVLNLSTTRGLVVNAGNANVFTGERGRDDVISMASAAADVLGCSHKEVFVASTGVIGEPLPVDLILPKIKTMGSELGEEAWPASCRSILTTDTFAKGAITTCSIDGQLVTIYGMAKGSGMIEPDMATMLAFIFTDANIEKSVLQGLLEEANDSSFNAITVDSDTSTSDTCLLFATGKACNQLQTDRGSQALNDFRLSLSEIMLNLAVQVVRDGEGATKLIRVSVKGARSDEEAKHVAKTIANSPLVKTAIAGEDANWGRVVMAVGKSGVTYAPEQLAIGFGGITITENGMRSAQYDESRISKHLQGDEVSIDVGIGGGLGSATVWTCDLTHGYISINADYRS